MARTGLIASYPLQQQLFTVNDAVLDAAAKEAVLLWGDVVISYSATLSSRLTFDLVKRASGAVRRGLISFDRRAGYESYAALAKDNAEKLAVSAHAKEAVGFLDANVTSVVDFKNIDLAACYASNVKNLAYLVERRQPAGPNTERLSQLFAEIDGLPGISLEWATARLGQLGFHPEAAQYASLVYHVLGGLAVDASASWPRAYSDALVGLEARQADFVNASVPNRTEVDLIKRHGLFDQEAYANLMGQVAQRSVNCDFDELPDALGLDRELIRRLSWESVAELATCSEARGVHSLVEMYARGFDPNGALVFPADARGKLVAAIGNLAEVIRSAQSRLAREEGRAASVALGLTAGSLLTAGAAWIGLDIDAALTIGGSFFAVSQPLVDVLRARRFQRVAALGQKIRAAQPT